MITMLLGGLWHGAAWTFVIWGGLHGLYLAAHKMIAGDRRIDLTQHPTTPAGWVRYLVSAITTFNLVCLTWIFFRAANLPTAWAYLKGIFTQGGSVPGTWILLLAVFFPLLLLMDLPAWWRHDEQPFSPRWPALVRGVAYGAMLAMCLWVGEAKGTPFIYFRF